MKHATDRRVTGVTWRAIAIGAILCVPNVFWVLEVEGMWHSGHPTTISLFWNVVLNVFILILANLVVKRFRPEWAMTQGELITIYVMLSVASGLAGHDTLALTIPAIAHPFHFATAENQWRELFFRYIPRHLVVYDPEEVILQGFYEGDALDQFYTWRVFAPWLRLTLWWTSFILALGLVMVCINIFVRKQWTEHEKLAYPIIQLPMAITEGGGTSSFFRNRALWIGFGLVAALDILNGLHALFPHVPSFPVRHDQRTIRFTEAPWSAMGNLPVPLYPFVIGLGYLLPLDLSFSMWFFYLFARFQQVFSAASGLRLPGAPFLSEQSIGGWMAVFFAAVWATRGHLRAVIAHLFGGKQMDDSGEPIRYRTAAVIMVMSFAYIVYFCVHAGMTIPIILPFMAFFFALSVGITRVRAEFGPPAHEMAGMVNGQQFLINILGTRGFGFENLGVVPFFWFFSGRGYREHIMPHQLEGLKMAERARMNTKRLARHRHRAGRRVAGIMVGRGQRDVPARVRTRAAVRRSHRPIRVGCRALQQPAGSERARLRRDGGRAGVHLHAHVHADEVHVVAPAPGGVCHRHDQRRWVFLVVPGHQYCHQVRCTEVRGDAGQSQGHELLLRRDTGRILCGRLLERAERDSPDPHLRLCPRLIH